MVWGTWYANRMQANRKQALEQYAEELLHGMIRELIPIYGIQSVASELDGPNCKGESLKDFTNAFKLTINQPAKIVFFFTETSSLSRVQLSVDVPGNFRAVRNRKIAKWNHMERPPTSTLVRYAMKHLKRLENRK